MIYMRLVDHGQIFNRLRHQPVFANDLDVSTQQGREQLQKLLIKRYEGEIGRASCRERVSSPV